MRPMHEAKLIAHVNFVYDNGSTPIMRTKHDVAQTEAAPAEAAPAQVDNADRYARKVSIVSTWSDDLLVGTKKKEEE